MNGSRTIRLVRHGRAAAGWGTDPDPDLDDLGREQASEVALALVRLGSLSVVTSPLLRCRSTAQRYADLAGVPVVVVSDVAEIPSPEGVDMPARVEWLRNAMQGTWGILGPRYTDYRDGVVDYVRGCAADTVIFSHFVAINTVIGACVGSDQMVTRSLDNCSITTVEVTGDRIRLIEGGREADTLIR